MILQSLTRLERTFDGASAIALVLISLALAGATAALGA